MMPGTEHTTKITNLQQSIHGNRTGPNVEVRCRIDTGAGKFVMPISVFSNVKTPLEKLWRSLIGPPCQHMEQPPLSSLR